MTQTGHCSRTELQTRLTKDPPGLLVTRSFVYGRIDTLEVRDDDDKPLTLVSRTELLPTEVGMISTIEATFRQSIGRIGDGTRFFIFDAGMVRACKKGRISVPFAGETYTWETPFPGCLQ